MLPIFIVLIIYELLANLQIQNDTLKENLLQGNENIGFGVWMKYQPFWMDNSIINDLDNIIERSFNKTDQNTFDFAGYHIYSLSNLLLKQQLIVAIAYYNEQLLTISHKIYYNFDEQVNYKEFFFENLNYEGNWFMLFIYFDNLNKKTTFMFSNLHSDLYFEQITIDIVPQFDKMIQHQLGGKNYIIIDKQRKFFCDQFKGKILNLFSTKNEIGKSDVLTWFSDSLDGCFYFEAYQIFNVASISQNFEYYQISQQLEYPRYALFGWVKLLYQFSDYRETLLIRVTENYDYTDDQKIGDRTLYIKYFQGEKNGFEVNTYSYDFPIIQSYQTQQKDTIYVLGDEYQSLLTNWHYIQYEIGTQRNNQQPIYQVYFSEQQQIQTFTWDSKINHFTGTTLYIYVGNDKYQQNKFQGYLDNLQFYVYCPIVSVEVTIQCHYSCQQCDGPTEQNCLSCSESSLRNYVPDAKSCECNGNYLDTHQTICQPVLKEFPQISIIEEQLDCQIEGYDICRDQQVQCSFGYFNYQNQCIQCPGFSIISKTYVLCVECLLYPENFYQNLSCRKDFMTYDQNEQFAYYEIERPLSNQEQFKININQEGNYYLTLLIGFQNMFQCKLGYYLKQEECLKCIEGCKTCDSQDICIECDQQYILTDQLLCNQITQCDTFQILSQKIFCVTCFPQQYLLNDACVNCGLYCASCDSSGFCNYCLDEQKYYLTLDGINCQICNIQNCKYCYQYFIFNNIIYTTLDINFYVIDFSDFTFYVGCALCNENYYFNTDQMKCVFKCTWIQNSQDLNQCQIEQNDCKNGLILTQNVICLLNLNSNISIQNKNCQNLPHCNECIENYYKSQSFCIICNDGYYSNILIGQCQPCLLGCQTCFQQNIKFNDHWKWNIKGFYKVMFNQDNNHPFEQYSTYNQVNEFEIICTSCFQGYILNGKLCIQGCTDKCQKCGFNKQEVVCVQCIQTQNGYLKAMTQNQYCMDCPINCAACYERTFEEINEINPQYLINSLNAKYTRKCYEKYDKKQSGFTTFINQNYQTVTQCTEFLKCKIKIQIQYYIYCSPIDYYYLLQNGNLLQIPKIQILDMILMFTEFDTQNHETNTFYEYLNEISVQEVNIQYIVMKGSENFCYINQNKNIITYLKQNVFTLQQVNVEFIGNLSDTTLLFSQPISFTNFNRIKFTNISLQFLSNQIYGIQLYNAEPKIKLEFENTIITSSNQQVQLQFTSNTPYFIQINNLTLKDLILNSESYLFHVQFSNNFCQKLSILDSIFYNIEIFQITFYEQQGELLLQNIQIQNSQFYNSSFFVNKDIGSSADISIKFDKFLIYQCQINNTIFLILQNTFRTLFLNIDVQNTNFMNSNLIFSLIFTIENAIFDNLILNNSVLICNQQEQLNAQFFYSSVPLLEVTGVQLLNILYNKKQSLMSILNSNFIKQLNIKISDLLVQNVRPMYDTEDFKFDNNISYYQAQIFIQCQICIIHYIQLIRSQGLPDFAILDSDELYISDFNINQQVEYQQTSLFLEFNLQGLIDYNFALYIGNYANIQIDNLIITKCIIVDSPLMIFQGLDLLQNMLSEKIIIKNSIIENNMLIVSKLNRQAAIISFYSEQLSTLTIENVTFAYNSLNQYYQDFNKISSTTMVLKLYQGSVKISQSNFIQNIIMNSTNSILNIQCQDLKLTNSFFFQNNIFNYTTICDNLDQNLQFLELSDLKKIFPIKSECGNGKFVVSTIIIDNITVNISIAAQTGGFYIILQGISQIHILNSNFTQTMNFQQQSGVGGCFNIDSSESQLNLIVSNCIFYKTISQNKGGAFYIFPSSSHNSLHFSDLIINDCFSIQGTFLWFSVNNGLSPYTNITFFNATIESTETGLKFFLLKKPITNEDEINLIKSQNSLVYIQNGENILLKNILVISVFNQILFDVSLYKSFIISNLIVKQGKTFLAPLFRIQLAYFNYIEVIISNLLITSFEQFVFENIFCLMINKPINVRPNQNICLIPFSENDALNDYDEIDSQNIIDCQIISIFVWENLNYNVFGITNFSINHQILIQNFTMSRIICPDCLQGIISIKSDWVFIFSTNLMLKNIQISDCVCGHLGCLSILNKINDFITLPEYMSELRNLQQFYNIDLLAYNYNCSVILEDSIFKSNTALYGGSLFALDTPLLIKSCQFFNNSAQLGGGVYFFSSQYKILIIQTLFIKNQAKIGGGLFLYNQSAESWKNFNVDFIDNNSTFSNNNAQEIPKSLTISLDKGLTLLNKQLFYQSDTQIIEKISILPYKALGLKELQKFILFPSGTQINQYNYFNQLQQKSIPYNLTFRIIALNSFGEQERYLDNSFCTIEAKTFNITSKLEIQKDFICNISKNNVYFDSDNGDYNLDDLIIYFNPIYESEVIAVFSIRCNQVQFPIYDQNWPYQIINTITDYQLLIEIKTFPCQTGEFLNSTSGACIRCDILQNQYQVKANATSCIYKDDMKINKISYSMVELRSAYWRAGYDSTVIESCYHFPLNCNGGWYPGDESCFVGHIGALCEQCDLYNIRQSDNYFRSGLYNCSSCNKTIENLLTIVFISLWTLISILISVSSTVEMIDSFIIDFRLRMLRILSSVEENSTAILIKAFTNYLQIISTISSFQLQLPEGLSIISDGLGNPVQSMSFSFDCYLISISNIEIIYFRIIWSLLLLLFYLGIFFGVGMILAIAGAIKFKISYATISVVYLFIYLQPNLVGSLISLFSFRVISEIKWVQGNVSYRYETQQHTAWLISFCLPLLLLFSVVIPLFLWYGVHKNKNKLQEPRVRQIWGYLYNEYIQTAYFWETIKIFQKQVIIIVLAYYDDHIPIKASLVFLVLFGYSYYSTTIKPYRTKQLNAIDAQITVVCAISIILGSSIYTAQQSNVSEIVWPFYIVIGVLNGVLIAKLIIKILFAYFKKLNNFLEQLKDLLFKFVPHFITKHPFLYKLLRDNTKQRQQNKEKFKKIRLLLLPKIKSIVDFKKTIMNQQNVIKLKSSRKMLLNQLQNNELHSNEQLLSNRLVQNSNLSLIRCQSNEQNILQDSINQEKLNSSS